MHVLQATKAKISHAALRNTKSRTRLVRLLRKLSNMGDAILFASFARSPHAK
jgi:hypothetical protein